MKKHLPNTGNTCTRFKTFPSLILCIILLAFPAVVRSLPAAEGEADRAEIVETVQVHNVLVPVRVFDGNKAVKNLKKEDFVLSVNGKIVPIHGFFTDINKLELAAPQAAGTGTAASLPPSPTAGLTPKPRLFVLIFNLCSAHQDLDGALDIFFDGVVRPGDRIMSVTNSYFLAEWTVTDPKEAKKKVYEVVNREINQIRPKTVWFQNELKSLTAVTKSRLDDITERAETDYPMHIFKDYFLNYRFILEDIKSQYLSLPVKQYIKIANYLKGQRVEKYVFSFYQMGRLPMIAPLGEMGIILNDFTKRTDKKHSGGVMSEDHGWSPRARAAELRADFYKFLTQLKSYNQPLAEDIAKAFTDTGATFHTMLLKPVFQTISADYQYEDHTSDTEVVLKDMANKTGGSILFSNNMNTFIKQAAEVEDVVYTLSYVPDSESKKKRLVFPTIRVAPADSTKAYRLIYDDRARDYSYQNAQRQLDRENPDLIIEQVAFNGDMLTVKLKNIKLVPSDGREYGAVRARIKIVNENARVLREFEKAYKGLDEKGVFKVALPGLAQGRYNILLEVKDLFSLTRTAVGEAVCIVE